MAGQTTMGPPVGKLNGPTTKSNARKTDQKAATSKRRCIGSACIACKRRKSKCDGALPSCAACTAVYGTMCEYDLASDHRRKGVYKKDTNAKPKVGTLQTLIEAILNYPEDEALELVKRIRSCENLEVVAAEVQSQLDSVHREVNEEAISSLESASASTNIERELASQIGHMRLADGAIHFLGGTSNLRFSQNGEGKFVDGKREDTIVYTRNEDIIRSWTTVTSDVDLILHLLQLYFTWHYPSFVTLSKSLFFRDFFRGKPVESVERIEYCTPLLVNAMLSLGCHFTLRPGARSDGGDQATAGDHFFREAKRLLSDDEEFETPRLPTIQALALMSVREAGCGREAKGWLYSGMSFRMACDLGLEMQLNMDNHASDLSDEDIDARRITFWGCYQFDKCWSNYLGRPPQLPKSNITVGKFEVFPGEDSEAWSPRNDNGIDKTSSQPARTRAVALQMSVLCEISEELLLSFYSPTQSEKVLSKTAELKKLSEFHTRLEGWLKNLPKEMEVKEGQLPYVLVMHMFFQLLYIHLFRPFLKYTKASSPLPPDVSPRKLCTQAAAKISKSLRLYKKTYGLKQICNIVVYIAHSACSIHLLNLPEKEAKRDLGHGVRHLEEISECWPCASRTLTTLAIQVRRWRIELPKDIAEILHRWKIKDGADPSSPMFPKDSPPATGLAESPSPNTSMNQTMQAPRTKNMDTANSFYTLSIKGSSQTLLETHDSIQAPNINDIPVANQTSRKYPPTRPIFQPSKKRTSAATLYSGIDSLFDESKDWWYKDQSTFYENWSRRKSNGSPTQVLDSMSIVMDPVSSDQSNLMNISPDLNDLSDWNFDESNAFVYTSGEDHLMSHGQI